MTIETITENLRAVRASADANAVRDGRAWYREAGRIVSGLASESGHTRETIAGVVAAYSLNASWKGNLTMARKCILGDDDYIRGLPAVVHEVEAMLYAHEDPADAIGSSGLAHGLKRADFYRNLLGRHTYVTCDRWHLRAAFATDKPPTLTPKVREMVTRATRTVAREFGESASACQAVIWCAIRGTGA